MKFADWLNKIKKEYEIAVEESAGDSHFISKKYEFTDPHTNGLSFTIGVNDIDEASIFSTNPFEFQWFNIAEGVKPEDITLAAVKCLTGNLIIKKGFFSKKSKLEFNLRSFKGRSKPIALENNDAQIDKYKKGYSKLPR